MDACEGFQSIIDTQENTSEDQMAALEQHLATCKSCTEYQQLATQTLNFLRQLRKVTSSSEPSEELMSRVVSKSREMNRQFVIALLGLCISFSALVWFSLTSEIQWIAVLILAGWTVGSALYAWFLSRKVTIYGASTVRLEHSIFVTWQKDLKFKIAVIRYLGIYILVEVFVALPLLILYLETFSTKLLVFFLFASIITAFVIYQYVAVLPRLKLELRQLDDSWT